MEQSNSVILRGVYEAFAKGDVPTVLATLDPNITWEEPEVPNHPWGGTHHGPTGVLNEVFIQIGTNFEKFNVIPDELIDYGNRVIVLGQLEAKARNTGKTFVAPFVHVATFENGKITRFQSFEDSAIIMNALQ